MATDSPTKKLMKPVKNTAPKEPVETVTTTEVKQVVKKLAPKVAEVETVVEEDLIVKTSHELENLKAVVCCLSFTPMAGSWITAMRHLRRLSRLNATSIIAKPSTSWTFTPIW